MKRSGAAGVLGLAAWLVCAILMLAGPTPAAARAGTTVSYRLVTGFDPLTTRWRSVGKATDGELFVPADNLPAPDDGKAVIVGLFTYYSAQKRVSGYSIRLLGFDCRTARAAYGDMDSFDARGRFRSAIRFESSDMPIEDLEPGLAVTRVYYAACGPTAVVPASAEARAATVVVSSGTGWLSDQGYIVTASHVVAGAETITLFQEGRKIGEARVVADDPDNDVAVLRPGFDVSGMTGLKLRGRPATLGQHVFTLGYPLADKLGVRSVKMAGGDITGLTGVGAAGRPDDPRYAQISIPVQSGNSGGPVIDDQGSVAGIVIAKFNATETEVMQNLNFALKGSYITALLADLPPVSRPRPANSANPDRVAAAKDSIFLILVEGH